MPLSATHAPIQTLRLQVVLGQLQRRAGEVVLFIDEIHTVVSAYGLADGAPRWLELPA